ncbi:MAG: hypothetical protein Q7T89_00635 [Anaerolineales bacterium]|nr:hypothetical protein [Anaerolineales bacterium]
MKFDWKNFEKQKTNKDRRKHLKQNSANHVCGVRNHSYRFDGAIGSYKLLGCVLHWYNIARAAQLRMPRFILNMSLRGGRSSRRSNPLAYMEIASGKAPSQRHTALAYGASVRKLYARQIKSY